MRCALGHSRADDGFVSARVPQLCGSSIEAPYRRRSRFHPAARALSARDETFGGAEFFRRVDQPMAQTWVVPFVVIEFHELVERMPQGAFPEEDHVIQAALLDGTHKSLDISIQMRRPRQVPTSICHCCRVGNWRGAPEAWPIRSPRSLWECLTNQTVGPFPAPATSNAACGFPALRFPDGFTSRVMEPIGPAALSLLVHDKAGNHRRGPACHTTKCYSTCSSRSLDAF